MVCPVTVRIRDGRYYLPETENCTVENCSFINNGKYAVCLVGGRNNSVSGNDVAFGSEEGINLINSAGNTISDNHIHHYGQVYKHIGGIVLGGTDSGAAPLIPACFVIKFPHG